MILEITFGIILLSVVAYGWIRHAGETRAREKADRIINGKEPAGEEQINKIITTLRMAKNFMGQKTEQDIYRIRLLRDIRKEMVTPGS